MSVFLQNKFFILGAARSGISAARLLKQHGASVFVSELNSIPHSIRIILQNEDIPFEEEGHNIENLCTNFNVMIVSPGIPLSCEPIVQAKKNRIAVMSEIELAMQLLNSKTRTIGITGTNGKSTTTHYLAHLLNAYGFTAAACGNIGTPLSEVIRLKNDYDALSIELSSYQLELGISKRFDASILLNLQNDHLTRHKTYENYLRAKWNLILATRDNGICLIDESVLKMAHDFHFPMSSCKIANIVNNTIQIHESCLIGAHNATNIYAASMAAMHVGVSEKSVVTEWEKRTSHYKPLAHRLEVIQDSAVKLQDDGKLQNNPVSSAQSKIQNLTFINDSKATNVESTLVALQALQQPLHLLLGGEPKGDSYLPLSQFFGKNVVRVYPFGKAASLIYDELKNFDMFLEKPSHGMIAASEKALQNSKAGDTILLSPACSSFDEFNHFEHRGEVFRTWVKSIEPGSFPG